MPEKTPTPRADQPDVLRRRLAKGGLAAPVVLATLASKSVLGAAPHNCTISGKLSGNTSSHGVEGNCSALGWSPSQYLALVPTSWPSSVGFNEWTSQFRPYSVDFPAAPKSLFPSGLFRDAFEKVSPTNTILKATVRDVLAGCVTLNQPTVTCATGWVLRVKVGGGFLGDEALALDLGRETVTACMNAIKFAPNFPLTLVKVVSMFNAVIVNSGTYTLAPGVTWNAAQVRDYFKSLHP